MSAEQKRSFTTSASSMMRGDSASSTTISQATCETLHGVRHMVHRVAEARMLKAVAVSMMLDHQLQNKCMLYNLLFAIATNRHSN